LFAESVMGPRNWRNALSQLAEQPDATACPMKDGALVLIE
jgi:uncharacterized protein YjeT (DUF2065 family)